MQIINNTTILSGEDVNQIFTEAEKDFAEYLAEEQAEEYALSGQMSEESAINLAEAYQD